MVAKRTKTKKTFKKKTTSKPKVNPIEENIVTEPPTVIPSTPTQPFQPVQPTQPVQPVQLIQPTQPQQPIQPVQPSQPVQPLSTQPQQFSAEDPSVNNTVTPQTQEEPEIKMGTEESTNVEEKTTDPKPESVTEATSDNKERTAEKKSLLLPILVIVLLGIAILGGLFIYRENFSKKVEEKISEVSLSPTPVEKPTAVAVDLSKFKIEILNGSGIEGAASNQKSDLEGMGFKVAAVGNADQSNYTETVIQAKKGVDKAFLDKLRTILEESFEVSVEDLDEEAERDIVIIIGSSKKE